MSGNLRNEMPEVAAFLDDLRAVFGKDVIDKQIRRGLKGEPTFWARENGHTLGTRNTVHTYVVEWDEYGIARSRDADWIIDARALAEKRGFDIKPADPLKPGDDKREAQELRDMIAALKGKAK